MDYGRSLNCAWMSAMRTPQACANAAFSGFRSDEFTAIQ
jgi:hypothetical protein